MTDAHNEPTMPVGHGDLALACHLRKSLEVLRDGSDNDEFRRLANDVLYGPFSLRDVYFTPTFAAGINPGSKLFGKRWEQLSREEQERLADQGQRQFDGDRTRLRNADRRR
ncbi:hypothetical protein AB0J83_22980 [Actinoplanes sp. NPDC049596]|uniref:hypothetical protein n=1 Tax=unclassified Actinoplanes TaxID=2626549 RepID=UPI0034479234